MKQVFLLIIINVNGLKLKVRDAEIQFLKISSTIFSKRDIFKTKEERKPIIKEQKKINQGNMNERKTGVTIMLYIYTVQN